MLPLSSLRVLLVPLVAFSSLFTLSFRALRALPPDSSIPVPRAFPAHFPIFTPQSSPPFSLITPLSRVPCSLISARSPHSSRSVRSLPAIRVQRRSPSLFTPRSAFSRSPRSLLTLPSLLFPRSTCSSFSPLSDFFSSTPSARPHSSFRDLHSLIPALHSATLIPCSLSPASLCDPLSSFSSLLVQRSSFRFPSVLLVQRSSFLPLSAVPHSSPRDPRVLLVLLAFPAIRSHHFTISAVLLAPRSALPILVHCSISLARSTISARSPPPPFAPLFAHHSALLVQHSRLPRSALTLSALTAPRSQHSSLLIPRTPHSPLITPRSALFPRAVPCFSISVLPAASPLSLLIPHFSSLLFPRSPLSDVPLFLFTHRPRSAIPDTRSAFPLSSLITQRSHHSSPAIPDPRSALSLRSSLIASRSAFPHSLLTPRSFHSISAHHSSFPRFSFSALTVLSALITPRSLPRFVFTLPAFSLIIVLIAPRSAFPALTLSAIHVLITPHSALLDPRFLLIPCSALSASRSSFRALLTHHSIFPRSLFSDLRALLSLRTLPPFFSFPAPRSSFSAVPLCDPRAHHSSHSAPFLTPRSLFSLITPRSRFSFSAVPLFLSPPILLVPRPRSSFHFPALLVYSPPHDPSFPRAYRSSLRVQRSPVLITLHSRVLSPPARDHSSLRDLFTQSALFTPHFTPLLSEFSSHRSHHSSFPVFPAFSPLSSFSSLLTPRSPAFPAQRRFPFAFLSSLPIPRAPPFSSLRVSPRSSFPRSPCSSLSSFSVIYTISPIRVLIILHSSFRAFSSFRFPRAPCSALSPLRAVPRAPLSHHSSLSAPFLTHLPAIHSHHSPLSSLITQHSHHSEFSRVPRSAPFHSLLVQRRFQFPAIRAHHSARSSFPAHSPRPRSPRSSLITPRSPALLVPLSPHSPRSAFSSHSSISSLRVTHTLCSPRSALFTAQQFSAIRALITPRSPIPAPHSSFPVPRSAPFHSLPALLTHHSSFPRYLRFLPLLVPLFSLHFPRVPRDPRSPSSSLITLISLRSARSSFPASLCDPRSAFPRSARSPRSPRPSLLRFSFSAVLLIPLSRVHSLPTLSSLPALLIKRSRSSFTAHSPPRVLLFPRAPPQRSPPRSHSSLPPRAPLSPHSSLCFSAIPVLLTP